MQNPQENEVAEVKDQLLKTLQSLKEDDFKGLKWQLENSKKIQPFKLETADRRETVDLLVQTFPQQAVNETIKCLQKIRRGDLVEQLSRSSPGGIERNNESSSGPSVEEQNVAADQPKNRRLHEAIVETVAASKERGGLSLPVLNKALAAQGYDDDNNRARIMTIHRLVNTGTLVQTKGTLKMNKKADTKAKKQAKKTTPKAEKPATPKSAAKTPAAKTPAAKKPAAKTPAAKKPAAKTPAAKTPAAKKPAAKTPAAKTPATKKPATKTPAAKKPATKTPATKKPAAKKPAAKKPKTPATKKSQKKMSAVTKRAAKKVPPAKKVRAKKVAKPKAKKAAPRKK